MVKQMKLSFASLLGAVALMAGCSDDEIVKPIVRGEGVQFGASASFEAGNDNRGSRTVYGDVINGNDGTKKIQLNWVPNEDIIDIAYPEAAQSKLVAYDVLDENHTDDKNKSVANTLGVHAGQAGGLQWGTPTNGVHHFYAVYPSKQMFNENDQAKIVMDSEGLTGYMPNAQDPKAKTGDATNGWVLQPDMRYAYMVATTNHAETAGANVSLDFHPLVTALEFSIEAADVRENLNTTDAITLQGIQLTSTDGNICGSFNYKFQNNPNYTVTDNNLQGATNFDQIYMNVPDGAKMAKGTTMDFTFFIVPTKNFDASKLKLTFVYLDTKGVITYKTAAINRGIQMRKKYFFKNISFPCIDTEASPSKWFSMLDNDIIMNQVSIPIAGNAFTNDYTDSDAAYHKQQVSNYLALWNQGVRGFELVTEWAEGATAFGNQHFVGGEKVLNSSPTFDTAVKSLLAFMAGEQTKNECLFLICHFHPVTKAMNPQKYVTNLVAYFDNLIDQTVTASNGTGHKITADDFVLYEPGMTVADVRGKVCIIIRPGDDLYMKMARQDDTSCPESSDALTLGGTLGSKMLLVKDWGSAYDRWDKRYTGAVREASWADRIKNYPGTRIEEYIYGCDGTYVANVDGYGFKDWAGITKRTIDDSMFAQGTKVGTSNGTTVYVQEWCRVVPQTLHMQPLTFYSDSGGGGFPNPFNPWTTNLQVKWPASIQDKKDQIDYLFEKSIQRNSICINVLSGYYITDKHIVTKGSKSYKVSIIPFKEDFNYPTGTNKTFGDIPILTYTPSGQGNGGNFAGLAADLNTYVYEKLTSDAYGVGPLGLVQIDFIGATETDFNNYDKDNYNTNHAKAAVASQNLVSFIAMNNFRFALNRKPQTVSAPGMSESDLKPDFGVN